MLYPKEVILDMDQHCLYGMTVLYDKSISIENVKQAIDARYVKWALQPFANSPVKLWRVEAENFAIQTGQIPGVRREIRMQGASQPRKSQAGRNSGAYQ